MKTILFDMDGVLFDFDKHFQNVIGKKGSLAHNTNNIGDNDLVGKNFFATMPLLKQGVDLLKKLEKDGYTIHILSSTGGAKHGQHNEVKAQKAEALRKAKLPIQKAYFVDAARKKAAYSKKGILIDDKDKVVKAFNQQGGKAFLFTPSKADEIYKQISNLEEAIRLSFKDFYAGG